MSAGDILGEHALPGLQKATFCVFSEAENSTLMTSSKTKHHQMRGQGFNTGVWRRGHNESCRVECTVLGMKRSQKVGQVSSTKNTESKEMAKSKSGSEASHQLEGSN